MATTPVNQTYSSGSSDPTNSTQTPAKSDPLASKVVFLKLLVEEVKNQDPMNPADSTQWVTQMAQYSQLEQMVDINKQVTTIRDLLTPSAPTDSNDSGNTDSTQETN